MHVAGRAGEREGGRESKKGRGRWGGRGKERERVSACTRGRGMQTCCFHTVDSLQFNSRLLKAGDRTARHKPWRHPRRGAGAAARRTRRKARCRRPSLLLKPLPALPPLSRCSNPCPLNFPQVCVYSSFSPLFLLRPPQLPHTLQRFATALLNACLCNGVCVCL